ncbi:MAG: hypothetical protein LIQ31_04585 [Planctomycetes bacterium]|nr:hypothetical protein [Planctomycetota bacterium]
MDSELDPPKRPRGRPPNPKPRFPKPVRPRGRPTKDIDDKKQIRITVRLTRAEHDLWHSLAEKEGVPLVDFITAPLRRKLKREKGNS